MQGVSEKASAVIPGYAVPESMLFAHGTRLADSWQPQIERIVKPAFVREPIHLTFHVREGWSSELPNPPRTRWRYRLVPRPRPRLDLSGEYLHDARYDVDSNVHHVFCNSLLLVLLAQDALTGEIGHRPQFKIVLRKNANRIADGIYRMMGFETIQTDANVLGRFLILPNDPLDTATYSLIPRLADRIPFETDESSPEKIYLSRRGARSVENEEEVWSFLQRRGFERYFFESEMPLAQQAGLVGKARRIVAVHGAGLGWLVLNHRGRAGGSKGGLKLIELFGAGFIVDIYRRYAANLDARWTGVRGRITPDIVRDLDFKHRARSHQADSFHVDLETLEAAFAYIGD